MFIVLNLLINVSAFKYYQLIHLIYRINFSLFVWLIWTSCWLD